MGGGGGALALHRGHDNNTIFILIVGKILEKYEIIFTQNYCCYPLSLSMQII
jgi:hypothetical protein